jgi:hypothetical protein
MIGALQVFESSLTVQGIQALIGRDILEAMTVANLTYSGFHWTLWILDKMRSSAFRSIATGNQTADEG